MFIELVDVLRCPKPHEESWLVLSASRMQERHVIEGELGCHVCQAHYRIRSGVAVFGQPIERAARISRSAPVDDAMKMAALLGLAEPGGLVIAMGETAVLAPTLEMLIADTQILSINPSALIVGSLSAGPLSALMTTAPLPLSNGCSRAVAIDEAHSAPELLAEAVRVLRSRGRLVIPSAVALPAGVTELARDEHHVVAERTDAPSVLVPLELSRRK